MQASDEAVRAAAREILARPEYQRFRAEPSELARWLRRMSEGLRDAWNWLVDAIPDEVVAAFDSLFGAIGLLFGSEHAPLRGFVAVVLAVVLLAGLVLLGRALALRRGVSTPGRVAEAPGEGGHVLVAEASALAAAQHWLEAAHSMQLAVLELLLRRRWLTLDRSEPNRTLRARIARAPLPEALRGELTRLLDRLESQWFRERSGDRALYASWQAAYESLERLGPAPEPSPPEPGAR